MNLFQQFCHHPTVDHEFYDGTHSGVRCRLCREVIYGPARCSFDSRCSYSYHESCAALPCEIRDHPSHPQHPLTAKESAHFICDGCRHYSWEFNYCCETCDLNFDVRCVSKQESQQLAPRTEIERGDIHLHKLQRVYHNTQSARSDRFFTDIVCCCCLKGFQDSAYACMKCRFFIHESCMDEIPQRFESPFQSPFHKHPLLLQRETSATASKKCRACRNHVQGLMLSCKECDFNLHIACCTPTTSGLRLKEYHEEHPMLYVKRASPANCVVCKAARAYCFSDGLDVYGCLDCEVYVHTDCIPLPRVVKHECHPYHALTLSRPPHVKKIVSKEYRCVDCEEVGDLTHPFYYCEKCLDIAHIDCVLPEEFPLSEILECLVHRSPTKEPKSREKSESEKKTYRYESEQDDTAKQQKSIDNKYDKSMLGKDKVQESEEQC